MGAENVAVFELKEIGMDVTFPCLHVKAYHWHCVGQNMHGGPSTHMEYGDDAKYRGKHASLSPCWQCPGIRLPQGTMPSDGLCRKGRRSPLKKRIYQRLFRHPGRIELCCSTPDCEVYKKLVAPNA